MKVVKQGLSVTLTLALALMMTPISALAVDSGSDSGVTAETIHPFTSTDDLIQSAYEELNKLGVTQETEKQDTARTANVEAASGMAYDQVKSYVYTQLMDNLEAGVIDVSGLNLDKADMVEVMDQVLYEYYLYNAITDLDYAVEAGKATAVTFAVSEGYASAMEAMDAEYDAVVVEDVAEEVVDSVIEVTASSTIDNVIVNADGDSAEGEERGCVLHTVPEGASIFDFDVVVNMTPDPQFRVDSDGNYLDSKGQVTDNPQKAIANGGLIYDAENKKIVEGLLPEVYQNLACISFTCAECGEEISITDADTLAQMQMSIDVYLDTNTYDTTEVPAGDPAPSGDNWMHYTTMQVAFYQDDADNVVSGNADSGQAAVEFYYNQLSAFNADHAEYFGVSTDYWTSKNTEANPMAALKVLCNLGADTPVPPAQMIQMVQMLPQAFMAYVYYYGGELLAMRDAAVAAVEAVPGATDVQKLLILHDWLAENATFDMGSMLTIAGESSGNDPIQMTTFGALLSNQLSIMQNSEYYGGICLAYAAAYTYLVQAAYPDLYTDGNGNWLKPADIDAKGGDIVDFSQVMFYCDTSETSVAGEGFGGSLFNNVHYFNAVKLAGAPTSDNPDDAMMGNWFYVDACYDDIYIECLSQYRAEAEGSVYHNYFLASPQTMGKLWADSVDYIDSLYDGYTYVPQVDENGNVTTPSNNVSTNHPDYDPTHPEYVKVESPNEVKNDNTCYEESWFSGAVSKIYNDGTNWYYVDSGTAVSSYSGMMNDNGEFNIDKDQMAQNGLDMDGMMHSSRVGVDSQDVMKSRPMSAPDYWVVEEDNSNNMGLDMSTKEDPSATVLFDYGTGKFSTNEEIDLKAAVVEDFIYNDQYPGLTHSIGLYEGVIYFNLGNQIYAYDVANATCELFKEYNTVSATSDGRPFKASSYTMDEAGTALTVENNPIAALCVRTAYTPLYDYVDANGNVVIDYMGNVNGDPSTIAGQVYRMMIPAPTMTVNIGTNYTFTYPSAENGYSAEAFNYNPDYTMGMSDEGDNSNQEFLWCANIREDVPMANWAATEAGEDAVPCSAQIDGHAYEYNADQDVYICSECNLHAFNVVAESEEGTVTLTSIPESGMSQDFINNNGGAGSDASTTTEPVSPEREAAIVQTGDIVVTATPIEGYGVEEVSYCYEGGESIPVTPSEDGIYTIAKEEAGCITVTVTYAEIQTIAGLTAEVAEATYTGSAQQPVLTIVDEEVTLVVGEHYVITSEAQTDVGTYEFTAAGAGVYEGEITGEWTIAPADIASVEGLTAEDQPYTGSAIEPTLSLTLNGTELVEGTDYTVAYANNVKIGTATITVTGKGNFQGSASLTFEITMIPVEIPTGATGLVYTGSEQTGVVEGEGYELSGVTEATAAGDYIVIATLLDGYAWSDGSVKPVEIEWAIAPADIDDAVLVKIPDQPWTGSAIEPELSLTFNGKALVEGRNYTVTYANNVNPGLATVTVTGIGNFVGTADASFNILQKARWEEGPRGWKYKNSDGTYSADCWQEIGGKRYHFGADGYMTTGWFKENGAWYYLKASGAMAYSEWVKVGGVWYHFADDGVMQTGWLKDAGKTYYLKTSGAMAASEWEKIDGYYYHFAASGAMQTGWLKDAGEWYYLKADGKMAYSEWEEVDGAWYYFDGSGAMEASKWIGNYYVLANGKMATSQWVGQYYVGADGKWIPGYKG